LKVDVISLGLAQIETEL